MAQDPVCGMTVEPANAAGRIEHGGEPYYFCSTHCVNAFRADPTHYAGVTLAKDAMRLNPNGDGPMKSRSNIAVFAFMAIAAVFLVSEHRAHLIGWKPYWPYLLLLACPLMHLFMHGGHGHRGRGVGEDTDRSSVEKK